MHAVSDTAALDAAQNDGTRTIHLRIPAKAEYVTLCRLALSGLAQLRDISDETMAELKLALTEAVLDDGAGFDPDGPPAAAAGEELSEGGLGIAIIKTIADEFDLQSQLGSRGSRLRFTKLLR